MVKSDDSVDKPVTTLPFSRHPMPPRSNYRLIMVSVLAGVIGILGGIAAEVLNRMIGLVTNLAYFQRFSTDLVPIGTTTIGLWVIVIPAIGGLFIGLMARYGSELVRGHGIPEAKEAVLLNGSPIPPRGTILKTLRAPLSLWSGQPFRAGGPRIHPGATREPLLRDAIDS